MRKTFYLLLVVVFVSSCVGKHCATCTKTIGGVAGNEILEVKEVCDESEASELEGSSSGTTVWDCQ